MKEKSTLANIFYNSFGTMFYYGCQWLTTLLVVRLSGYTDAGVYSIATTFTAAFSILALYNTRQYQVADVYGEYSDKTYIASRLLAMAFAFFICAAALLFNDYTPYQWGTVLLYMVFKCVEAWVDVYHGIDQKNGRMDYVCYSYVIRGILMLAGFSGTLYLTKNLVCAMGVIMFLSVLVAFFYDKHIAEGFIQEGDTSDAGALKKLMLAMIPLVIVAVTNNLSVSFPKYFLDRFYDETTLGYYTSVATPSMIVQVAAQTIFIPLIRPLADRLKENDRQGFIQILKRVTAAFVLLSIPALIVSALLGEWFLVLVFGEELRPYTYLFVPVIVSTLLISINACLFPVCTVLKEIKGQMVVGIGGAALSFVVSMVLVKQFSMNGVVIALLITLSVQIIIEVYYVYRKMIKWKEVWHG